MILDTTVLIDLMRNKAAAVARVQALAASHMPLVTTAVSVFELFSGIARSQRPGQEKQTVLQVLAGLPILPVDRGVAERAGETDGALAVSGEMISSLDSLIAGTALIENQALLTRNIKDFSKIKELAVETY